jgi:hypothetical protein
MKIDLSIILLALIPILNIAYGFVFGLILKKEQRINKALRDLLFNKIKRQGQFIEHLVKTHITFEIMQDFKKFMEEEEVEDKITLFELQMFKSSSKKEQKKDFQKKS